MANSFQNSFNWNNIPLQIQVKILLLIKLKVVIKNKMEVNTFISWIHTTQTVSYINVQSAVHFNINNINTNLFSLLIHTEYVQQHRLIYYGL